jgi:hypothetical protein
MGAFIEPFPHAEIGDRRGFFAMMQRIHVAA